MNIFELFAKAQTNLKYPHLTLTVDGLKVKLATNSHRPGVFISNGKYDFDRKIYGVIHPTDIGAKVSWRPEYAIIPSIRPMMIELVKDPIKFCSLHGLKFSYCCFCGKELTAKESLFAGYGPICADNWGLPWGEVKQESTIEDL